MTLVAEPRSTAPAAGRSLRIDRNTVVLHRLHGATVLALHCETVTETGRGRMFAADVVDELEQAGLLGHVLWSTSCRVDAVEPKAFARLADAGLFLVRLDLGRPAGTAALQGAIGAVQTLRRLGVLIEYEFDLHGPTARFSLLRSNIGFLRSIVSDGSTPAFFRLAEPDASYSPWLAAFHRRLAVAVEPWLGDQGLSSQLSEAWAELVVAERLLRGLSGVPAHRIALQRLTMRSNIELLRLVDNSARDYELYGDTDLLDPDAVRARCAGLAKTVLELRTAFIDANASALIAGRVRG